MPICSHCAAVLVDGEKFCRKCGERVQPEQGTRLCPACGQPNGLAAKFCKSCGEPLPPVKTPAVTPVSSPLGETGGETGTSGSSPSPSDAPAEPRCPHCGAAVKVGAHFCKSCGRPLAEIPEGDAHGALTAHPDSGGTRLTAETVETAGDGEPKAAGLQDGPESYREPSDPPEEILKSVPHPSGRGRRIAQVVVVCCALAGVGAGSFFYFRNRADVVPSGMTNGTDNGTTVNATLPIPPDNGTAASVTPPIPSDNGTTASVTPPIPADNGTTKGGGQIPPDNGASGTAHKSTKDQGRHGKHVDRSVTRHPPMPQPPKPQPPKPTPEEKKIHDQLIEMKKSLS